MSNRSDPDGWRRLYEGEECPICRSVRIEGECRGTIMELDTSFLTAQRDQPVRGSCCLVPKRHVVGLHELEEDAARKFMMGLRRVSGALKSATGSVKMNLELHGNTIPHLHAHFFPRYVGDRFEEGPIDLREPFLPELSSKELEDFADGPRAALVGD
ncbi:MAG TPA: HIT family protein [Rubrobacter sp.]|nr:HIT family protein [Rubrobacter sp.]